MQKIFVYIEERGLYSDPNQVVETISEDDQDVYDEFKLDALSMKLIEWTKDQKQDEKEGFFCDFTVSLDFPFASENDDLMAVWAGHDCSNWDLYITMIFPREQTEKLITYVGTELSERRGCYTTTWIVEMDACEFYLPANNRDLTLLFKGGYHPIWYEHEWNFVAESYYSF